MQFDAITEYITVQSTIPWTFYKHSFFLLPKYIFQNHIYIYECNKSNKKAITIIATLEYIYSIQHSHLNAKRNNKFSNKKKQKKTNPPPKKKITSEIPQKYFYFILCMHRCDTFYATNCHNEVRCLTNLWNLWHEV